MPLPFHSAHIVLVGGTKGGSGKTLIACSLAAMAAAAGLRVLLIDADTNSRANDFNNKREADFKEGPQLTCVRLQHAAVRTETLKLAANYDLVIIDAGGSDNPGQRAGLTIAHTMLIPVAPDHTDIWSLEDTANVVNLAIAQNPTLAVYGFLNRVPHHVTDTMADFLAAELAAGRNCSCITPLEITIGRRDAYNKAYGLGRAVTECKPRDVKAVAEITELYQVISNGGVLSVPYKKAI